jgi:hypothetical protein
MDKELKRSLLEMRAEEHRLSPEKKAEMLKVAEAVCNDPSDVYIWWDGVCDDSSVRILENRERGVYCLVSNAGPDPWESGDLEAVAGRLNMQPDDFIRID